MAARKAPSGTSGVPVTRSGRQPSTIGTPRLRATSARCEPAAPVRAMTPRAANRSGASAGAGRSTSRIASPQSPDGRSCGRQATSRPAAVPGAPGRAGTCSPLPSTAAASSGIDARAVGSPPAGASRPTAARGSAVASCAARPERWDCSSQIPLSSAAHSITSSPSSRQARPARAATAATIA